MQAPNLSSEMQAPDSSAVAVQSTHIQSSRKRHNPPTLPEQPLRKSARLSQKQKHKHIQHQSPEKPNQQLPSPSSSITPFRRSQRALQKKRLLSIDPYINDQPSKRSRIVSTPNIQASPSEKVLNLSPESPPKTEPEQVAESFHDSVAHWATTKVWPKSFLKGDFIRMSKETNKRKTESTHRSDVLERMEAAGIYMKSTTLIQQSSKDLCKTYLQGDRRPEYFPSFPSDQIQNVLLRAQFLNENRIQRDITPCIVPSAENLFFCGETSLSIVGEELNAPWSRCTTLGSTQPKPDYTAGLLPKAFTKEELEKLRNYASVEHPIFVTPTICFPFLMCEAKSADVGISVADRQNIHSASIAVKVIIDLYKVAFNADPGRINELYGKILVFTVSHDHDKIQLCGHYATLGGDSGQTLEFYRHVIAFYSLAVDDGEQIFKPYNFVWNVYKSFVPHHLKRIQVAVEKLDKMEPRTGASFDMSQMGMGETNSQSNPEGQMLPPPVPDSEASQLQRQFEQKEAELQRELKQKEAELQRELKQKEAELQRQLKKTEADHKEERRKDREAAEKQREDTKKQMDSLVKQLEQQNKQMERLMKLVEKKV